MKSIITRERTALFAQPGIGEVVQAISSNRRGRVKFKASFWPARFYSEARINAETLALPLDRVVVVGIDGITLLVAPLASTTQIA